MDVTIDELAADLQAFFAERFPPDGGNGPGSVFLVFDNLGTPLESEDFSGALFSQQRAAQLADQVPHPAGLAKGCYLPSSGTRLSRWYGEAIEGSTPLSGDEPAFSSFTAKRQEAIRLLEQNKLILAGGGPNPVGIHDMYYATQMTPADWDNPASDTWQSYRLDSQDRPPERGQVPPPPDRARIMKAPWRIRSTDPELAQPTAAGNLQRVRDLDRRVMIESPRLEPIRELGPIHQVPTPLPDPRRRLILSKILGRPAPEIVIHETSTAPVTSSGFRVSFQYCLVRFDRPWWDDVFLTAQWKIPGRPRGEISTGLADGPFGVMTLVTVGMLVVKDLLITATWSDADETLLKRGISFGPFSVSGAHFDALKGEISRSGMQVIAWLCQVPPVIPPA